MLRVVEDLCTRMSYYASTQEVIDANLLFIAWSTDSVSCYLENKPAGLLRDEQKARNWKATVGMVVELTPVVKQITLVMPLVLSTPEWLMRQVSPALNRVLVMHKVCPFATPLRTLSSANTIPDLPCRSRSQCTNESRARQDCSGGSNDSAKNKTAL